VGIFIFLVFSNFSSILLSRISPKPKTLPKVLSGTVGQCVLGTEACPGLLGRRGFHRHLTFGVKLSSQQMMDQDGTDWHFLNIAETPLYYTEQCSMDSMVVEGCWMLLTRSSRFAARLFTYITIFCCNMESINQML
jgi:hypothetical protein